MQVIRVFLAGSVFVAAGAVTVGGVIMAEGGTFCQTAVAAMLRLLAGSGSKAVLIGLALRLAAERAGTRRLAGRVDPFMVAGIAAVG